MDPIQRALAELRAIPVKAQAVQAESDKPSCCSGDRRGYQWHQRTGNLPACAASRADAKAYMREYYDRAGRYAGLKRRQEAAARRNAA